jgi:hypothetical protein
MSQSACASGVESAGFLRARKCPRRDGGFRQIRIVPRNVRLDAGGAVFLSGSYLESAPNATGEGDTTYFYADLEFTF